MNGPSEPPFRPEDTDRHDTDGVGADGLGRGDGDGSATDPSGNRAHPLGPHGTGTPRPGDGRTSALPGAPEDFPGGPPEPVIPATAAEEPVEAHLLDQENEASGATGSLRLRRAPRRRRVRLPVMLFLITCVSVWWVGSNQWEPSHTVFESIATGTMMPIRQTLVANWQDGLIYTGCVLAILLTHEMGHFLATVRYRIHASYPYFIPLPISPIGTLGAVIGMDGMRANRKELFDIGLAGPIAGLFVAVPVMWIGVQRLDFTTAGYGPYAFQLPLAADLALQYLKPPGYEPGKAVWLSQFNPYFMAGWVGLLITGLNMLPVSQLDGGHVVYTVFGRRGAHWIARGFILLSTAYIAYSVIVYGQWSWIAMLILVLLIGPFHPPTRDDTVELGWPRRALGGISMLIPVFCFIPQPFVVAG